MGHVAIGAEVGGIGSFCKVGVRVCQSICLDVIQGACDSEPLTDIVFIVEIPLNLAIKAF